LALFDEEKSPFIEKIEEAKENEIETGVPHIGLCNQGKITKFLIIFVVFFLKSLKIINFH
jgi:hypothetical protein